MKRRSFYGVASAAGRKGRTVQHFASQADAERFADMLRSKGRTAQVGYERRTGNRDTFYVAWKPAKRNPCRLKGRKVKGGRSVTLRNMASVTIIRRRNGTVGIRGVKK